MTPYGDTDLGQIWPRQWLVICYLTAPSHWLVQYWFLIIGVLWHSPDRTFTANDRAAILYNEFENDTFKITATAIIWNNKFENYTLGNINTSSGCQWENMSLVDCTHMCFRSGQVKSDTSVVTTAIFTATRYLTERTWQANIDRSVGSSK